MLIGGVDMEHLGHGRGLGLDEERIGLGKTVRVVKASGAEMTPSAMRGRGFYRSVDHA